MLQLSNIPGFDMAHNITLIAIHGLVHGLVEIWTAKELHQLGKYSMDRDH